MAENDEQDLDLEGDDVDEGDDDGGAGDGDAGDPPKGDDKAPEDKRFSDLQSRADKAEARANKAEAALAKIGKRDESGAGEGSKDPERDALMTELREASLDAVYGEFEELKEFGIDRALVEGSTRAEMRESATSLVALVKAVSTKARNKTLREHGIKAEPAGATRQPPKSYDSMSDEEFEKELARAKSGGANSLW